MIYFPKNTSLQTKMIKNVKNHLQKKHKCVILPKNFDKEREMANIKSAKKRILVSAANTERNKSEKSKIATYTKKFKAAVEAKNVEEAKKAYTEVTSVLDSAVAGKVIHANCAARRKARLAKELDSLNA